MEKFGIDFAFLIRLIKFCNPIIDSNMKKPHGLDQLFDYCEKRFFLDDI